MALSLKVHALGTKNDAGEDCKGNVSIYGLNARFPITLYPNQWRELARVMPTIIKLVDAAVKEGKLSMEPPKKAATANGKVTL
jgi:hypothetical protein